MGYEKMGKNWIGWESLKRERIGWKMSRWDRIGWVIIGFEVEWGSVECEKIG